ncbi:MAG: hypothetical protein GX452_09025 [Ignavibacteriales bacterium]|nr:hypothetical protein [Ignavibacteriaceae bacterium]NLH61535.1 hypothetical protein [Ignavibacteriales bacterium]
MKKTYILLFLIIFTHVSFATIRYVSKTGSSTPPYTSWLIRFYRNFRK